jgi:hypothetical protein
MRIESAVFLPVLDYDHSPVATFTTTISNFPIAGGFNGRASAGCVINTFVQKLYIGSKLIGPGNIIAADFINRGKSIKSVRYQNAEGKASYYTSGGNSMRKTFLRTPIDFARSSTIYQAV